MKLYIKLLVNSFKETFVITIKPKNLEITIKPDLSDTIKEKLDFIIKSISDTLK